MLVVGFGATLATGIGGGGTAGAKGRATSGARSRAAGVSGLRLVVVLKLELLKKKVGAGAHEGMRLRGQHGLDMAELGIQVAEKVEHLTGLRN
jgi:hypothetical protein